MADILDDLPATMTSEMTAEGLYDRFGPIPLWRIVFDPAPGTATFDDLLARHRGTGRYCELVDGILLEKDVSLKSSRIAADLIGLLQPFVKSRKLGLVTGEQGFLRLTTGRVRGPDVAYIARDRLPGGQEPEQPVPELVPTLAVEVISPGNTKREMEDKLADYFDSGVDLVWYVYPKRKEVVVFTSLNEKRILNEADVLKSEEVLPGFSLIVAELFANPLGDESAAAEGN